MDRFCLACEHLTLVQISSPTVIRGDLIIDQSTVLSLTPVPGLGEPLLTVLGTATITGTLVMNHASALGLSNPFLLVAESLTMSGNVVATFGRAFSPTVCIITTVGKKNY